jgi:phage terminase large subunit
MKLDCTEVFEKNWDAINLMSYLPDGSPELDDQGRHLRKYRYIINTGSSRSSKTYSLIDCYDFYARRNPNKRLTAWRETKKDCKDTVLMDFLKRLRTTRRFIRRDFNKTESVYQYPNGSQVEIRGTDEHGVFGLDQDAAWFNEPYGIDKDTFDQIDQRTSDFIFIDWNPKQDHFIDTLMKHPRALVIHSTFQDNPFCPPEQRIKILSYDPSNPENVKNGTASKYKWDVYGRGIKGEIEGKVFADYKIIKEIPAAAKFYGHGLDFGYSNDPAALVSFYEWAGHAVLDERIYSTGLLSRALNLELHAQGIKTGDLIIADRSGDLMINELFDLGWDNIHPAKGPTSIVYGISTMKDRTIYITERSVNLIREFDNYRNAKNTVGKYLNEPAKGQEDHAIDASRYIITDRFTHL